MIDVGGKDDTRREAVVEGVIRMARGTVEMVQYHESTRRVLINATQGFENVAPDVWEFRIGGYQVAEKWLKDRKGRTLSYEDVTHYQRVLIALAETTRLMAEIDARIPGWPLE